MIVAYDTETSDYSSARDISSGYRHNYSYPTSGHGNHVGNAGCLWAPSRSKDDIYSPVESLLGQLVIISRQQRYAAGSDLLLADQAFEYYAYTDFLYR